MGVLNQHSTSQNCFICIAIYILKLFLTKVIGDYVEYRRAMKILELYFRVLDNLISSLYIFYMEYLKISGLSLKITVGSIYIKFILAFPLNVGNVI